MQYLGEAVTAVQKGLAGALAPPPASLCACHMPCGLLAELVQRLRHPVGVQSYRGLALGNLLRSRNLSAAWRLEVWCFGILSCLGQLHLGQDPIPVMRPRRAA